jgi:hypothetical protein
MEGAASASESPNKIARWLAKWESRTMVVAVYVTLVVLAGAVSAASAGAPDWSVGGLPLLFWFLANLLGEVLWLPAPKGRGYLSMANAANFATILCLPLSLAIPIAVAAGLAADLVFRRRVWSRALFNAGLCAVTVDAAARTFQALGGGSHTLEALLSPLNALPLAAAAAVYFLVNTWLVAGAISIHRGHPIWTVWRESFAFAYELVGVVVLHLLGFIFAALFFTWGYMSAFVAVFVTYFIRDAYVRYTADTLTRTDTVAPTREGSIPR